MQELKEMTEKKKNRKIIVESARWETKRRKERYTKTEKNIELKEK